MKRSTRRLISIALSVALLCNPMLVVAAGSKGSYVAPGNAAPVSDRLIVKFKPKNLARGISVAQIRVQLSQPLAAQTVSQLQAAAGVALSDLHAISNGAHVLAVAGRPGRQALDNAIAGISRLPDIEYVEEDRILTAQAAATDLYYNTGPGGNPGLWGMQAASAVAAPAPGGTGSYGADFETAWNTITGTGVVVAVVDTGITPNVDIVGASGVVAAGAGSNLVSTGYDFISDCRVRASCPANTATASADRPPLDNATDLGDFITAQDKIDNPAWATRTVVDSSWHGTHVAGTIAALGYNATGVIGGAYNARVLPVRALGKGGGSLSDIAEGIMWAAGVHPTISNPYPAKVINMSLGGVAPCSASPTMQNAVNAAVAAGAVVVVAAGNENQDVANSLPASCQNVISVAAIARDGSRASYSNHSSAASNTTNPTNVTLAAQGSDPGSYAPTFDPGILSTLNTGTSAPVLTGGSTYDYSSGTSMATPHVAAAAALMIATNPALTPTQIKTILSAPSSLTAFPSFNPSLNWASWDCAVTKHCGAGILNANLAVQNSGPAGLTAATTTDFGPASINTSVSRTITFTNGSGALITLGTAAVSGNNGAFFSMASDGCSTATLVAGDSCSITLSYAPTATGVHTATLTVPDTTALSSPAFVALTGAAGSQLATTTPSTTATTVTVGQSTTVNLSYNNPNWIALPLGAIILSQPAIMATSADACSNTTLAAGASCTVTVTITPTVAGSYSGTASLSLSGSGTTPAVATISGAANAPASSGGGGGGCSIMPFGADPDVSLMFAMLAVAAYWFRRRVVRGNGAD
jgi:serine protease